MPNDIIGKTPEQLAEEAAILAHVIVDPQVWVDNAIANNLPHAIPEKIAKYRQEYLNAKYLSIAVDPGTEIETRVKNPDYLNRAERDALEEAKRKEIADKAKIDRDSKLATKPDMEKSMSLAELKEAVKCLYEYLGLNNNK